MLSSRAWQNYVPFSKQLRKQSTVLALLFALGCGVFFAFSVPENAYAAIYYVRTDGSDTNCSGLVDAADPGAGALPRACAFRTIQKAHDVAPFDSTINVQPGGIFNTAADVSSLSKPLTIQRTGYPAAAARPVIQGAGAANALIFIQSNNITIQGLEFRPAGSFTYGVIGVETLVGSPGTGNYANINILDNVFSTVNSNAISANTLGTPGALYTGFTIQRNTFTNINGASATNGNGIFLRNINVVSIISNTFTGVANYSNIIVDSTTSTNISSNVITGTANTTAGVEVRASLRSASGVTIQDNSITGIGSATGGGVILSGVAGNSLATVGISRNNIFNNGGSAILVQNTAQLAGVSASNNRIPAQTAPAGARNATASITNNGTGTLTTSNNWFATAGNGAPGAAIGGSGTTNVTNWLGLRVTSNDNVIETGGGPAGTSNVLVDFVSCNIACPNPLAGGSETFYNGPVNTLPQISVTNSNPPPPTGTTFTANPPNPPLPSATAITRTATVVSGLNASPPDVQVQGGMDGVTVTTLAHVAGQLNTDIRIVNRTADIAVTKSFNRNPISAGVTTILNGLGTSPNNQAAGGTIQYNIIVQNLGPSDGGTVTVTDTFSAGLTNVTWNCTPVGTGASCAAPNGTGDINTTVNLPSGTQAIFIATATVPANSAEATVFNNQATATVGTGVTDPVAGNNTSALVTFTAHKVADIGLTKTLVTPAGGGNVPAGSSLVYRFTMTNNGPSVFDDALGGGVLPALVDFFNNPAPGVVATVSYVCSIPAQCTTPGAPVSIGAGVSNPLGNIEVRFLTVGQSVDITMTVNIDPTSGPGTLQNLGQVLLPVGGGAIATPVAGDFVPNPAQPPGGAYAAPRDPVVTACGSPGGNGSCNGLVTTPVVSVTASADVSVVKSRTSASPVLAGSTVTYQVVIQNNGPAAIPTGSLTFTDFFSDAVQLNPDNTFSAAVGCVAAGGATCGTYSTTSGTPSTDSVIPAGGSLTLTYQATLDVTAVGQTITNTATASLGVGFTDPNLSNNTSSVTDIVGGNADLGIVKTIVSPGAVVTAGTTIVFQLQVTNAGPTAVSNVPVADPLPAGHTPSGAPTCSPAGGGVCGTAGVDYLFSSNLFSATIPSLPSGGSVTYQISAVISPSIIGSVSNFATVSSPPGSTDPGPTPNISTVNYTVVNGSVVDVNKLLSPANPQLGQPISYTILVTNTGTGDATQVGLIDNIPNAILNPTWVCTPLPAGAGDTVTNCGSPAAGAGSINIPSATGINLAPGGRVQIVINGTLSPSASGIVTNQVTVSTGDAASVGFDLGTVADLAIDKTATPQVLVIGDPISYTLSVQNGGPNSVVAGLVTDNFDLTRIVSADWTCAVTDPGMMGNTGCISGSAGSSASASAVTSIAQSVDVAVGGKLTFVITPTLQVTATGTLTNTALISGTGTFSDPFPLNNTSVVTTALPIARPDLTISKVANSSVFTVGQNASYTIVVTNTGQAATSSIPITVTDTLPAGITFVSNTNSGWLCSPVASTLTCLYTGAAIAPNASTAVTLTVAVGSAAFGTGAVNTAVVSTGETELSTANNTATSAPVTVNRTLVIAVVSGSGQSTQINSAFAQPLVVKVTDALNTPISGVSVTFTPPGSGASCSFTGASATTDASGVATSTVCTANATVGTYTVNATAVGATTPAGFTLTNTPFVNPGSQIKLLPAPIRIATTIGTFSPKLKATGLTPSNPPNTSSISILVAGANGIPSNATGLVGVLTNINCTNGGNLRLWAGANVPNSTNLNVPGLFPQLNLSTNFVVGLDGTGKVNLGYGTGVNGAECGYAVDAVGYLTPSGSGNVFLLPSTTRIAFVNDNTGTKLTATGVTPTVGNSSSVQLTAAGAGGIPSNAVGVMGILTNVGCDGGSNLRTWASGTAPNASNLNIPGALPGLNLSTGFVSALSGGKFYLGLGSALPNKCGYVVDISAYILAPTISGDLELLSNSSRVAATIAPQNGPKITSTGLDPSNPPNSSTVVVNTTTGSGVPVGAAGVFGILTNVGCNNGANFRFWSSAAPPFAANLNVPGALPALNLSTGFATSITGAGTVNLGLGSGVPTTCGYVVDVSAFIRP
jgi:uncharacterized repeat protein (TIGR01451 family)